MFDDRLKKLREEKKMNKKEVAIALNLPYSTYLSYENNDREPNSDVLIRIAKYFEVSIDYLLGLSKIRKKDNEYIVNRLRLSEKAIDVLEHFNKIDDDIKQGNPTYITKMQIINKIVESIFFNQIIQQIHFYCLDASYVYNENFKKWDFEYYHLDDKMINAIDIFQKKGLTIIDRSDAAVLDKNKIKDFFNMMLDDICEKLCNHEDIYQKYLDYISTLSYTSKSKTIDFEKEKKKRELPYYTIGASAGNGNFLATNDYILIEADEYVPQEANYALCVKGDSMEPKYKNGQMIYVKTQKSVENGEIGIFCLNNDVYVKKFECENGKCMLISLNPAYDPIKINDSDEIMCFGKVLN